jgi:hypothetical protein
MELLVFLQFMCSFLLPAVAFANIVFLLLPVCQKFTLACHTGAKEE